MSNRKLLVLSTIFLALFLFVVVYERHQPNSEEAAKAKKRLVDFKPDDVTGLLVERPDLPKVEMTRKPGAAGWSLETPPTGAADAATAGALASDLARLEVVGEIRENVDPKEYGLDAPKAKVTLAFKGGRKLTISFGKEIPGTDATAAAEGPRFGAVKFAPVASLVKPVDEYRSKVLVEVPGAEITRISILKGPNKIVLAREARPDRTMTPWRLEAPVADLASSTFAERLLSDLTSERIAEFPTLPASDLPRVGLQPAAAVVTLQKGAEVVATLAFGAAKADAAGKVYARVNNVVAVVGDRVPEDLAKEVSAFREAKLSSVESYAVRRISLDAPDVRAGAEKVDGEWNSGGQPVPATLPENLAGLLSRAERKAFVARKDYAAWGIPAGKDAKPVATLELLEEHESVPRVFKFFTAAPMGPTPVVAVEVSGRPEALVVERSVLDDLKREAGRLRDAANPKKDKAPAPSTAVSAAPRTPPPLPSGPTPKPKKK
jgi:Domain of unknown function (DUF4340)